MWTQLLSRLSSKYLLIQWSHKIAAPQVIRFHRLDTVCSKSSYALRTVKYATMYMYSLGAQQKKKKFQRWPVCDIYIFAL